MDNKWTGEVKEIGSTGLAEFSGQIREDFLSEMTGKNAYKRFNEMRLNCPVIAAELMAIEQSIRSLEFYPESEAGEDPRVDFLKYALDNMSHSFNDHLSEALTMLAFGWTIFEIVYEQYGMGEYSGLWGWKKFAVRGQGTLQKWEFDDTGGLKAFWQTAAPKYTPIGIPIEKCLLYRTRVEKNNPEGRSILRSSWIPYYYWKNISQIEAIGIERDLAGLPVCKYPQGATDTDIEKAEALVRNVRNDEQAGVTYPEGFEFSLMSSGGSRLFDTDKIINRYENRMLMASLAQFLMLGAEGEGSLALSADQTSFWAMSTNAVADSIAEVIQKFAIPRLLALNGWDANGISFKHTPAGEQDLASLGTFLGQIASLLTWTPQDEKWLRGVAKLPEIEEDVIIEERDRKNSIAERIASAVQAKPDQNNPDNKNQDQQNNPDQKGNNPDQTKLSAIAKDISIRRPWEGRTQRLLRNFFPQQKNRILKAAKELRKRAYPFG
jgi:hypothetical protein